MRPKRYKNRHFPLKKEKNRNNLLFGNNFFNILFVPVRVPELLHV